MRGLNKKEEQALKEFKIVLKKELKGNIEEVILFGSKARKDARKDSDLDVLVVISSGDWHTSDAVCGITTDILLKNGICISAKVINKSEYSYLSSIGNDFIRNVIHEGIEV